MNEENKDTSSGASSSATKAGLNIMTKSTVKGTGQPEKRSHSEVAESSFGDEISMLNKQLEQINTDLQQTRDSVKGLMNKDEMQTFIVSTVETLIKQMETRIQKNLETELEKKLEGKLKEKTAELNDRLDGLVFENVQLREEVDSLKNSQSECEKYTKEAMERSNRNEQYSRKNNVKIMGVEEQESETEESLTERVTNILAAVAKVKVEETKLMALHRIPGKSGMPKPVLLKLMNNSVKTSIMKKRQEMKRAGYRLVDDVTKHNTTLINKLSLHSKIDSAWYFNGNVFGKTNEGKRHKFDICSDIDEVIKPKRTETEKKDSK